MAVMSNLDLVATGGQSKAPSEVLKEVNPKDIGVIKNTVAKGATDSELAMFLTLANRYGLDPFLKEIWCIKRNEKVFYKRIIEALSLFFYRGRAKEGRPHPRGRQ